MPPVEGGPYWILVIRLGLCCTFAKAEIKFRTTTARYVGTLAPARRPHFLGELALHNAGTLVRAVEWCAAHGVGAFRVNSQVLPLYTHPEHGYRVEDLIGSAEIVATFRRAGALARENDVRLSMHPDQFVVVGSDNPAVVASGLAELEYQAEVGSWFGVEQLTIHGGGASGGKEAALERLARGLERLSPRARAVVVLENDDRTYTVRDLLPVCRALAIPLVYDVHHHRCNPDGLSIAEATSAAMATWGAREPWFHLSSPDGGWEGKNPRQHQDDIDPADFPAEWLALRATVDVEAKAKEEAVLKLRRWLLRRTTVVGGTPRAAASATPDKPAGERAGNRPRSPKRAT